MDLLGAVDRGERGGRAGDGDALLHGHVRNGLAHRGRQLLELLGFGGSLSR